MKRRVFITLGGAAETSMLLPLAAREQPPERVRRIGLLFGLAEADEVSQSYLAVFRQRKPGATRRARYMIKGIRPICRR